MADKIFWVAVTHLLQNSIFLCSKMEMLQNDIYYLRDDVSSKKNKKSQYINFQVLQWKINTKLKCLIVQKAIYNEYMIMS